MAAPRPFAIELNGQRWTGDWQVSDGMLHIGSAWGSKSVKIKTGDPETLAKIVLAGIVKARR